MLLFCTSINPKPDSASIPFDEIWIWSIMEVYSPNTCSKKNPACFIVYVYGHKNDQNKSCLNPLELLSK